MKVKYTSANGRFEIEFEVSSQKQLFEEIASFQEVFEQSKAGKKNYRFVVRRVGDDRYYELLCLDDGEKLGFGVNKKEPDKLFPRRRNTKTKEPIGTYGWHTYTEGKDSEDG